MIPALIILVITLILFAAIGAVVCLFAASAMQRSDETQAERAYRWREEMRAKSHDRQYR